MDELAVDTLAIDRLAIRKSPSDVLSNDDLAINDGGKNYKKGSCLDAT